MKRTIMGMFSAAAGILLAIMVHCSFMIVEVDGSDMLPTMEPGQKAVVFLLAKTEDMAEGDIIAYYPYFYTVGGGEGPVIRRIKQKNQDNCVVISDATLTSNNAVAVENKDILGKVIMYG